MQFTTTRQSCCRPMHPHPSVEVPYITAPGVLAETKIENQDIANSHRLMPLFFFFLFFLLAAEVGEELFECRKLRWGDCDPQTRR